MNGKEIAIDKLLNMSIEEICNENFKDTNIEELLKLKQINKEELVKMTNREFAIKLRKSWICPQTFGLDDLCMRVFDCVNCVEYGLDSNYR